MKSPIGTMHLALDAEIIPTRFAHGAAAAVRLLQKEQPERGLDALLDPLRAIPDATPARKNEIKSLIHAVIEGGNSPQCQ